MVPCHSLLKISSSEDAHACHAYEWWMEQELKVQVGIRPWELTVQRWMALEQTGQDWMGLVQKVLELNSQPMKALGPKARGLKRQQQGSPRWAPLENADVKRG